MAFSVTILGSGSALPTSQRIPTAHLVNHDERFFLLDCAEGVQAQMRKYRVHFSRINHIFISHLHGDHILGLPGLLSTFSLLGRRADLHLYGPAELDDYLQHGFRIMGSQLEYKLVFHAHNNDEFTLVYSDKKLEIFTFPLRHRLPCIGFLFREKPRQLNLRKEAIDFYDIPVHWRLRIKDGADFVRDEDGKVFPNHLLTIPQAAPLSYAFCTDTLYMPSLVKVLGQVDVLYHESTFLNEDLKLARATMHSTTAQAAQLAQSLKASKLILGHYSSRYPNLSSFLKEACELFPNTVLAKDGDVHNISR